MLGDSFGRGVVYTAISGGKDHLVDPEHVLPGVDYVCFTDTALPESNVWQVRPFEDIPFVAGDAVRTARFAKILPHRSFKRYDWSLWIDGNIRIEEDLSEPIAAALTTSPFSALDHHKRDCIFEEADACIALDKDAPDVILKQKARYAALAMPPHWGLTTTMILLRRHNRPEIVALMQAWWNEVRHFSRRDQISLDFVCWRHGMRVNPLFGPGVDWRTLSAFRRAKHA